MLFIENQEDEDLRGDICPEFPVSAFKMLNNLQYDPKIRDLYQDAEALSRDVFILFYYRALSANHPESGLPERKINHDPGDKPEERMGLSK